MPSLPMILLTLILIGGTAAAGAQDQLPGTKPLTAQGDPAAQMVEGVRRFYLAETERVAAARKARWEQRDVGISRDEFAYMLGVGRNDVGLLPSAREPEPARGDADEWRREIKQYAGRKPQFRVFAVRWPVLNGVDGEGLLLIPRGKPIASVIAIPDCDMSPEQFAGLAPGLPAQQQMARRLVERGCLVLIPVLIDRKDDLSGHPNIRFTNQPHREFLWRAAYEVGRTPIGYEVEKVESAIGWFGELSVAHNVVPKYPIGVLGYGEGGLVALYTSALTVHYNATAVSGYFGPREKLWSEPIYRNVFGLLAKFGDAEIASMPYGHVIIEASRQPNVSGPPAPRNARNGAAPGAITTPSLDQVRREYERAAKLTANRPGYSLSLLIPKDGEPGSDEFIDQFLRALTPHPPAAPKQPTANLTAKLSREEERAISDRMSRQFHQLLDHTQRLMREAPYRREEFWKKADASSPEKWAESTKQYRDLFWEQIIGRLPAPTIPMNPRTRLVYDEPKYRGYEVMLDVYPDDGRPTTDSAIQNPKLVLSEANGSKIQNENGVFAYGILLVPKNLKPGEKRPVVVCQHGLEGRPQDVADPKVNNPSYNQYACRLAEQGFITYAPQNPYTGHDDFRVLLRMAQPLGKTLFSVIARQHERTLDWLGSLPFVDPQRMAFYGLSYGGKTAMRMPAILERYCLSICSADYNEWIWKCMDVRSPYCYLYTNEYDMPEWNLANTFNYAEMSWLICPRPFMVERGHLDGVAPDEWVAYEYARTRQRYDLMGIGDRTEMEVFNGPHTIHGVGTFAFLKKHLKWNGPE